LSSKLTEAEERRTTELFKKNVYPEVDRRLKQYIRNAERLTLEDPSKPVYVTVTVEMSYSGYTGTFGMSETLLGVSFVSVDGVSRERVHEERTVSDETVFNARAAQGGAVQKMTVRRLTYSQMVGFEDPTGELWKRNQAILADQKAKRVAKAVAEQDELLYKEAAKEAEAGRSARHRAELGQKGPPITARERAERNDPRIDHTGPYEREKAAKIQWVLAYLKYTTGRKHLALHHGDATRYLDELQGRWSPQQPGLTDWPDRLRDPAEQKALKDWLNK
jgi:hypothetical protein